MRNKIVISVTSLSVLAVLWVLYFSLNPNMNESGLMKFLSIDDLIQTKETSRVRLGGVVSSGSINILDTNKLDMSFNLAQGDDRLLVNFVGTRPDLFKDDAEVIIEGKYMGDTFYADQLQVKCASRFEGELRDESSYYSKEQI